MEKIVQEFNRVEKLCNRMYSEIHGVTIYIKDMENVPKSKARVIPCWDEDYRNLRRIRHVRNALVHEDADADISYSDADIEYLEDFYQRLMHQQDPLALLKKEMERPKLRSVSVKNTYPENENEEQGRGLGCLSQVALLFGVMVLFALMILAGWILYNHLAG